MASEMVKCTCSYRESVEMKDGKQVKTKVPLATPLEMSVPFDFGSNLDEAASLHTKDQVYALYHAKGVIFVQDAVRRWLAMGKTPEEILNTLLPQLKFGATVRTPVDAKAAARSALVAMSPEERRAFLAELAAAAKQLG